MAGVDLRNFHKFGKKIVGIGRNYYSLAQQYSLPVPDVPLAFLKPTTSYVKEGNPIVRPDCCKHLVYEVELGVVIGADCRNVEESEAEQYIGGYALTLDMTAKDLQDSGIKTGKPWFLSKGFDTFTPISDFVEKEKVNHRDVRIWLKVGEEMKQEESTKGMIFSVPNVISYVSKVCTLERGDLILTGTPGGAGIVEPGQSITCGLGDAVVMSFPVV